MKKKKDIKDELGELSPFLNQLKKEDGFQVPPRYFETMQEAVFQKLEKEEINQKETAPSWVEALLDRFFSPFREINRTQVQWSLGLATVAILIFAGLLYFPNLSAVAEGGLNEKDYLAEVTTEEMEQYISDHIEDIDDELLLEVGGDLSELNYINTSGLEDEDVDIIIDDMIDDLDDNTLEELL